MTTNSKLKSTPKPYSLCSEKLNMWIEFTISAVLIVYAGIKLTTYADRLSERLQIGKMWVGVVLLGFITSLPEAITSLVAIISLGANDLAIGNMVGSNNFNPMLLVVMDVVYRTGPISNRINVRKSHETSALLAILLSFIVIVEIRFSEWISLIHFGRISLGTMAIFLVYFLGMKYISQLGMQEAKNVNSQQVSLSGLESVRKLSLKLLFSAIIVVVGAMWLANSADTIAANTGLGRTFVGSILLAFITSLPEMVVSLSALKLGALDLAVGNILGSNMTNVFLIGFCGLFHRGGPILATVSKSHEFTACLSILLVMVLIKAISTRQTKSFFKIGYDSLLMAFIFLAGTGILYKIR